MTENMFWKSRRQTEVNARLEQKCQSNKWKTKHDDPPSSAKGQLGQAHVQ